MMYQHFQNLLKFLEILSDFFFSFPKIFHLSYSYFLNYPEFVERFFKIFQKLLNIFVVTNLKKFIFFLKLLGNFPLS